MLAKRANCAKRQLATQPAADVTYRLCFFAGKANTSSYPRFSKTAVNRWHLSLTLLRNPQLRALRVYTTLPWRPRETTDVHYEVDSTSLASHKPSVANEDNFLLENITCSVWRMRVCIESVCALNFTEATKQDTWYQKRIVEAWSSIHASGLRWRSLLSGVCYWVHLTE